MTFERPELLQLAPAAIALVLGAILWQWRRSKRLVDAYGGPAAARRLTGRGLDRFPALRLACVVLATVALVVSASGVRRDLGEPPPPAIPVDLIVALDVSHSMTGTDVAPSRIGRARDIVARLVENRVADRVALTLFADWPYGLVPLTDDPSVVTFFTPWVEPELIEARNQGTSLAALVGHAGETWRERSRPDAIPVVLVVSDGESHGTGPEVLDSIRAGTEVGIRFWTAGIGSGAGAPLFVSRSSGAPLLDGSGNQAVAGYDADLLRDMARLGGGTFHDVSEEGGVRALVSDLRALGGESRPVESTAFDPSALLILVALGLLGVDVILDSGARWRRSRAVVFDEDGR